MRNAFIEELLALAQRNDNIALVVGDVGYSVVEPFAQRFPDRFINAGVAEQNMTGMAAGLASEGYHVFTYSIANFPTFRCAEQICNDVDYHRLPVTVVSVGGVLAYGALGYSHHAVQDYALMQSMPNTVIAAPGNPMEVRACLRYLVANPGPSYLRLGKAGKPSFHAEVPQVAPGQWLTVAAGGQPPNRRTALLPTNAALGIAMELRDLDPYRGSAVHSMPLWGMRWKAMQPAEAAPYAEITTLKDHLVDGGFGSWLIEALACHSSSARVVPLALSADVFGMVGSQASLNALGGLAACASP